MAAFRNASAIRAVKMDRRKGGPTPRGRRGDAEGSQAADEDSGVEQDVLVKVQEFFQICDIEGKGFIARQDMQVKWHLWRKRDN